MIEVESANGLRGQFSFVAFTAIGQHEARTVLRSPVRGVVNKNSTEPQAGIGN